MPKENSTGRRRAPNLPKKYREAAHAVYMTVEFTPRGPGDPMERYVIDIYDHSKSAIKANITRMCLRAGVERTDGQRKDFEAAIREALRKQAAEGFDAASVLRLADNIARTIEIHGRKRGGQQEAGARPSRKKAEPETFVLDLLKPIYGICGFIIGEQIEITEVPDLKVWEIGAVQKRVDDGCTYIGRVVAVDAHSITLRDDECDKHFDRAELDFVGRVKPEPVGRVDGMDVETLKKWAALKVRLAHIDADDITNCTARLDLERELFDLEHPKPVDDWSAWEGAD